MKREREREKERERDREEEEEGERERYSMICNFNPSYTFLQIVYQYYLAYFISFP